MHATKALIYTCTCIVGLAGGQMAAASTPDARAAATTVACTGPQSERIHDLLAEQGLPSARSLARGITREIVRGDEFVPSRPMLRPHGMERISAARAGRRATAEPDQAPAYIHAGNQRSGVLSSLRNGLSRILEYLRLSG